MQEITYDKERRETFFDSKEEFKKTVDKAIDNPKIKKIIIKMPKLKIPKKR